MHITTFALLVAIMAVAAKNRPRVETVGGGGGGGGGLITSEGDKAVCLLEDHCGKGNLGCPVATFSFGI